jgi:putative ABC transport system permease protein
MNILKIAYRSIQHRGLASWLTMISMALGVMLVVTVLCIHGVVTTSFRNNSSLGYNLIVGAKGGQEQLTLNTVYYLSRPVENIPYDYYLEFLKKDRRVAELKNSLKVVAFEDRETAALLAESMQLLGGISTVAQIAMLDANHKLESLREVELDTNGKYGGYCEFAIPVCLGDYLDRFRVVGTTPEMFDSLVYDVENNRRYEFAQGRNFMHKSSEHGYFEAVLGATVAKELKLKIGDEIAPSHGAPGGHKHERKFTIVGILKGSGTPNDRAVFANMEGFYLMEDHAKPTEEESITGSAESVAQAKQKVTEKKQPPVRDEWSNPTPLPTEQREITALLVRTSDPILSPGLQKAINKSAVAQAVFPTLVIYNLFDFIVRPVQQIFLLLTVMICVVSGISILVSIYNSMSERRHEIAVMRALGARREQIMGIVLIESILLAFGGGLLGFVVGHGLIYAMAPFVEEQTGVLLGFWHWEPTIADFLSILGDSFVGNDSPYWMRAPAETILVPLLLVIATVVGLIPAFSAYRTDVAKSLGK